MARDVFSGPFVPPFEAPWGEGPNPNAVNQPDQPSGWLGAPIAPLDPAVVARPSYETIQDVNNRPPTPDVW